jgi:LPXTG-motif cell wall-anchored protein
VDSTTTFLEITPETSYLSSTEAPLPDTGSDEEVIALFAAIMVVVGTVLLSVRNSRFRRPR